jgi:hypothetical protein
MMGEDTYIGVTEVLKEFYGMWDFSNPEFAEKNACEKYKEIIMKRRSEGVNNYSITFGAD